MIVTSMGCTESIWKGGILNVDAQKKKKTDDLYWFCVAILDGF